MDTTVQTPVVTTGDLPGQRYEVLGPVSSMGFNIRGDACDRAFERGVSRLQEKAQALGADAVIGLRQNLSWSGRQDSWAMQLYGTAVRIIPQEAETPEEAQAAEEDRREDLVIAGEDLLRYVGSEAEVTIPAGVRTIGPEAFRDSGVERVILPDTVRVIRENAFAGCSALTEVVLPPYLEKIADGAFRDCSVLRSITLPASLQEIAASAFDGCPEDPEREDYLRAREIQARDAEYLRTRRPLWRQNGRCQYCGGFFKGGLNGPKICSMCGMPKDY